MAAKRAKKARPLEGAASATKAPKKKATKKAKAPKPPKRGTPRAKVPSAADYLRDLRAMKDVTEEDFAFMSDPLAHTATVTDWISTGVLAIDRLTGGGWPLGRIVEVASWESVGKSTLLDQSIAQAQRDGVVCVLIDSERARDASYTQALGVDLDSLIIHRADTIEEAFVGIDRVLAIQEAHIQKLSKKKGMQVPPMLIVWDSIGGTPTKAERDGAADDRQVADAAKVVKRNMRRLVQRINSDRVAIVFANQFYAGIGPFSSLNTYGGSGIRYFTSLRLWLSRRDKLKVGKEEVGHIIEAKLRKTRITKPRPPAQMGLIYGAGIHNAYTLFEWGKTVGVDDSHRWISHRPGGWSYLMFPDGNHQAFTGSFVGFSDVLTEHPAIYAKMFEQYQAEG